MHEVEEEEEEEARKNFDHTIRLEYLQGKAKHLLMISFGG